MEPVDGTWAMAGGWGAVGGEEEGWTGLDGEGAAQGGLGMMPLEGGERPPPGNLAETSCTRKVPALYPHLLFLLLLYWASHPFLQLPQAPQGPEAPETG